MKKKHLIFVITRSDTIGGAQIHILNLTQWLLSKGYKISVIHGGQGILYQKLKDFGAECYPINSFRREINFFLDIYTIFSIRNVIIKLKPDLISVHSFKAGLLIRTLKYMGIREPLIYTAHGFSIYRTLKSNLSKVLFFKLEYFLNKRINKLITVCKIDKKYALKNNLIKKNRIDMIHNGVFESHYKNKYEENTGIIKLITIARFEWPKDFKTLFKALSILRDINWELTIIGIGPDYLKVKNYADKFSITEKIKFEGLINDVDKYLSLSNIFILSSYSEGFPRSILQAMSNSLPIIASNVGGIRESVIHGYNGYLFKPGDYINLSNLIKKICINKKIRGQFSSNSFKNYRNNFQFELMANKTELIYKKLLKY